MGFARWNKNRKVDPWPLAALAPPIPISCLCLKVSGHPGFAVHFSHFGVPCLFFGCGFGNFIGKNHSAGSDYDHTISMDGLERTSAEKCDSDSPNIRLSCFPDCLYHFKRRRLDWETWPQAKFRKSRSQMISTHSLKNQRCFHSTHSTNIPQTMGFVGGFSQKRPEKRAEKLTLDLALCGSDLDLQIRDPSMEVEMSTEMRI